MEAPQDKGSIPLLSVGIPVYNSEATVVRAIESILNQTLHDLEIIVSDNGSTDSTFELCQDLAKRDSRIKLFRQTENIGAEKNFQFVFQEAQSEFFCWAASDDFRSPDFLEVNYRFLSENSDYAASCSHNCFIGDESNLTKFGIPNDRPEDRFIRFLQKGWETHGLFYSVFRKAALDDCKELGSSFFAFDWYVDLCLLFHGKFNRSNAGLLTLGAGGSSMAPDFVSKMRTSPIEYCIPFLAFWKAIRPMSGTFPIGAKSRFFFIFCSLNFSVFRGNLVFSLKQIGLKR